MAYAEGYLVTPEIPPGRRRGAAKPWCQSRCGRRHQAKPRSGELEIRKTFAARSKTIRKKVRSGMAPRSEVVERLVALLRQAQDPEALIRVARQLTVLLRAGHI